MGFSISAGQVLIRPAERLVLTNRMRQLQTDRFCANVESLVTVGSWFWIRSEVLSAFPHNSLLIS